MPSRSLHEGDPFGFPSFCFPPCCWPAPAGPRPSAPTACSWSPPPRWRIRGSWTRSSTPTTKPRPATASPPPPSAPARRWRSDAAATPTYSSPTIPSAKPASWPKATAAEQGPLMRNEFIVVGPPDDPAGCAGTRPARGPRPGRPAERTFISRADDSGTHRRELELWAERRRRGRRSAHGVVRGDGVRNGGDAPDGRPAWRVRPDGPGTFRHLGGDAHPRGAGGRRPAGGERLPYTLPVRPRNPEGARELLAWLRGPGQAVIADYGVARFGEPAVHSAGGIDRRRELILRSTPSSSAIRLLARWTPTSSRSCGGASRSPGAPWSSPSPLGLPVGILLGVARFPGRRHPGDAGLHRLRAPTGGGGAGGLPLPLP
jgi:hypothetical protein